MPIPPKSAFVFHNKVKHGNVFEKKTFFRLYFVGKGSLRTYLKQEEIKFETAEKLRICLRKNSQLIDNVVNI